MTETIQGARGSVPSTVFPTGTVAFLFTDIEGSTQLWERVPEKMRQALARHNALLDSAVAAHDGIVFKTVGDAYCAAFHTPRDGVLAALDAQRALTAESWDPECVIRVRMAVHVGGVQAQGGDYFGPPVNRVARLLSAGHGGQTLISQPTWEQVHDALPVDARVEDMGEHRLKDLVQPEHIYQVLLAGIIYKLPPIKTLDYQPTNLPVQPSAFVGRAEEVRALCEMLRREDVRLLTLTGPGGTGKTRLALQVGAGLIDDFKHGVFFVSLSSVNDPDLIPSTIATALSVREVPGQPILDTLKEHLRDRRMLLIVDNFEHVLAGAPVVSELLKTSPGLKVLATSRSVLQLTGETDYAVPPMTLPNLKQLPALDELLRYDAVALFVQRAQAAKLDFVLDAENARPVAEICAAVDGLPLAIELAAARVKVFPPAMLLSRLARRLSLLTGGGRDLPTRQQTLRATIDWSFSLLDEIEQRFFAQLSVFAGGCTTDAAAAVCELNGDLQVDFALALASLVDKSLLREEDEEEARFRMLSTIREYAQQRLQVIGDADRLQARHLEYYLKLAEEAEPAFRAADQDVWLRRLAAEHDNMRAALDWALAGDHSEVALQLSAALHRFWEIHGHLSEGRQWLEQTLDRAGPVRTRDQMQALIGAGWISYRQQDLSAAGTFLNEALELARAIDDETGTAEVLYYLGAMATQQGDFDRAQTLIEESLDLHLALNDTWGIALATNDLANIALSRGDYTRGVELLEEALELARHLGQHRLVVGLLFNLGYAKWCLGDYEAACEMYEEALSTVRGVGDKLLTAMTLSELALTRAYSGNWEPSREAARESLTLFRELDHKLGIAEWLENAARIAGYSGRAKQAALLHGAADALRSELGAPLAPGDAAVHERDLAPARQALGACWQETWERGRALGVEEAIDLALATPTPV